MENIYSSEWDVSEDRPGFRWHRIRLARRLGGNMLGASIYVIAPGQKTFPYHFHHANEEMLIVLDGAVTVRSPSGEVRAERGDATIFTKGPDGAHQIVNHSDDEARILMMSTMVEPEIAEYPDSGHVGLFAGKAPGAAGQGLLSKFLDGEAEVPYWES